MKAARNTVSAAASCPAWFLATSLALGLTMAPAYAQGPMPGDAGNDGIKVTMLGTGTPDTRVDRLGPSTLIEVGGYDFLIDAGRGTGTRLGQLGMPLGEIDGIFLTHFHSDHTIGVPDIFLTGFIPLPLGGRQTALPIYGPEHVQDLAEGLMHAYHEDIKLRKGTMIPAESLKLEAHPIKEGVVFDRDGVKITAFLVSHDPKSEADYGYKVEYGGHKVVFSGDTTYDPAVAEAGAGADLIVHEVAVVARGMEDEPFFKNVVMPIHTSPEDAGRIFAQAQPKLAVFNHIALLPGNGPMKPDEQEILQRAGENYDGRMVVGEDLMTITITEEGVTVGSALDR